MRRNNSFRQVVIFIVLVLLSAALSAAPRKVSGTIVDSGNAPLPGVAVVEVGTNNGVITDLDGNFSINLRENSRIEVSAIGFKTQVLAPEDGMRIRLEEDALNLDESVVVGYGSQKKANLTGAVASVKAGDVVKSQSANISNTLIGYVPGIIAKQATGEPGDDSSTIYIRGIATYKGGTAPAFIIDGIERSAEEFQRLNANDIESISVLKDAASAAVFGMRAANGVILVTTKRGQEGLSVNFSSNLSIQSPTRLPEFANSYDFARLYNEFMGETIYTDEELQKFKDGSDPDHYPDTDWYGLMLKHNAIQHNHNLSVSGGSNKVKYFVSLGYLNQGGLWDNLDYNKYDVRSNVDISITRTTTLSIDLSHRSTYRKQGTYGSGGVFENLVRNTPNLVAVFSDGHYALPDTTHPNVLAYTDPEAGYNKTYINSTAAKVELKQDLSFLTPGLSVRGVISFDKYNSFHKSWSVGPQLYYLNEDDKITPQDKGGASLGQYTWDNYSLEYQIHANYARDFNHHHVSAMVMGLAHKFNYRYEEVKRSSFDSAAMDQLDAGNSTGQTMKGNDSRNARASFVSRVNYSYKDKYLFEANLRCDASENFAPKYRWGTFWSTSAGWVISEEDFFAGVRDKISFLKLRGSFGYLGNDDTGGLSYPYYARFNLYGGGGAHTGNLPNNMGDYIFGSTIVKGLVPGAIPNEHATWEKSQKANVAVDLGLFNMVNLSVDYFHELRSDILAQKAAAIPESFGGSLPLENFGIVKNQGVDVILNFFRKDGDFEYSLGGTFTYARNEIVEMAEPEGVSDLMRQTGRPISCYYGYKTDGLFQTQEEINDYAKQAVAGTMYKTKPGDIKYVNVDDSDKIVNSKDRTFLGYGTIPEIIYGINGSFRWRFIDMSFLFQGAAHVQIYLIGGIVTPFYNSGNIPQFWVNDHWTEENTQSRYPRLVNSLHNIPNAESDVVQTYLYDASYLRLKNFELGFSLPDKYASKARMKLARIYFSGSNLFTITKVPQVDPENLNSQGWAYPNMKSFNVGINIKF